MCLWDIINMAVATIDMPVDLEIWKLSQMPSVM